jgi:AcrR family transcriptional regulator
VNATVDDVRTRILHEATRQFAARGYEGTSIQQIAKAVGITRPTLVYHFGSKDQLRREVLETLLAHWKDELPRVLQAATTGSDRFRNATGALLSFFRDDPNRARLLNREMLDRPDEMTALFAEHLQPWTALISEYIRRGQQEGRIREAVDPEAYVLQTLHAVIGTVATGGATRHILRAPPDLDRQLDELMRIARTSIFNDRPK